MPRVKEGYVSNLRKVRESRAMSVDRLAEKTGISKASIYDYESGKRMFNADRLYQFADALDASADEILGSKFYRPDNPTEIVRERYESGDLLLRITIEAFAKALTEPGPTSFTEAVKTLSRITPSYSRRRESSPAT